jgi:CRISPR-associated protein Csm1
METSRLDASSRVALAAYLHDLGKFAERARLPATREMREIHEQLYCPRHFDENSGRQWYSHKHAAYTALAMDILESRLPPLAGGNLEPFAGWHSKDVDDSLVNAAAKHHRPESYLQWIIATADRVASGFDRASWDRYNKAEEGCETGKNHYQARQLTLFEQVMNPSITPGKMAWRYPLRPLSPAAMMPQQREACEPADNSTAQNEYRALWEGFVKDLENLPLSHRQSLPLWLDHFDSLWQCYTHAIPAATAFGTRPDVALYDHSRTTAALATALWRYHAETGVEGEAAVQGMKSRDDWSEHKLLLVQADLFGIQDFIFQSGGDTRKFAAKLLRGRSFQVSLFTELAGLKVLEALELPATSMVLNAAGKLLIVAANTALSRERLLTVQRELNLWFLEHAYGESGIGLAWEAASCNDFLRRGDADTAPFQRLMNRLIEKLDKARYQHFDLCGENSAEPVFEGYLDDFGGPDGRAVCPINGRFPAEENYRGVAVSRLACDQIHIGEWLAQSDRFSRLLITTERLDNQAGLKQAIFGYCVHFTDNEGASGKFAPAVASGVLRRAWDFSLPAEDQEQTLFNGYARRAINAYVPTYVNTDTEWPEKYPRQHDDEEREPGAIKTLNDIACEDRLPGEHGGAWLGIAALGVLKGDIDDLGLVFAEGLKEMSFARMAGLSRQVNLFFTTYLPWLCRTRFPNSYTVFAGGDDFFLLGPWKSQLELAATMNQEFARYSATNPALHFSAAVTMGRQGQPVPALAQVADEELEMAKRFEHVGGEVKNAVVVFGQALSWEQLQALLNAGERLAELRREWQLSTQYLYALLEFTQMAEQAKREPSKAIWRSRFVYRTERMVVDRFRGDPAQADRIRQLLTVEVGDQGIARYGLGYKVALQHCIYRYRQTGDSQ